LPLAPKEPIIAEAKIDEAMIVEAKAVQVIAGRNAASPFLSIF
jgi:indole-3-glycerol phosphate synthase